MILKSISQVSQSQNDSVTCLPNYQLRLAALNIERGKLYAAERDACRDSLKLTLKRISIKDSIISEYKNKDITYSNLINSLKEEIAIVDRQKSLVEDLYKKEKKLIRKQKLKTIFFTAAGVMAGLWTTFIIN